MRETRYPSIPWRDAPRQDPPQFRLNPLAVRMIHPIPFYFRFAYGSETEHHHTLSWNVTC